MIQFTNSGAPITVKDINSTMQKLGITLPESYENFLLKTNGGIPSYIYFTTEDNDYVIDQFYAISNKKGSFQSYFRHYKLENNILPKKLAAIADDAFGNLICISLEDEDKGSIYFWNHEFNEIHFLSTDIDEFINHLKEDI